MAASILLTGATGQIGCELRRTLAPIAPIDAPGRAELDLLNEDQVRGYVRAVQPSLIVNAAAYTDVDAAEEDPAAIVVNGLAPGWLAEEAAELGVPMVHYSTDYVFGGDAERACAYRETDLPAPINEYGHSKWLGERNVAASGAPYLILRTSWIYATRGRNFLVSICRLAQEREELRVVDDQIGAPTWAQAVAESTAHVLAGIWRPDAADPLSGRGGLYHLSAGDATSWHGFATAIVDSLRARGEANLRVQRVVAICSEELKQPARRPHYSVLDNEAIGRAFDIRLPDWQTQLEMCFQQ